MARASALWTTKSSAATASPSFSAARIARCCPGRASRRSRYGRHRGLSKPALSYSVRQRGSVKSHSPLRDLRASGTVEAPGAATRWQALVEHVWDIISLLDSDGKVMYTSPSISRLLGYEPEQRNGAYAFDMVHPDDRDAVEAAFREMVRTEESSSPVEYRFKHADGTWRSLES